MLKTPISAADILGKRTSKPKAEETVTVYKRDYEILMRGYEAYKLIQSIEASRERLQVLNQEIAALEAQTSSG